MKIRLVWLQECTKNWNMYHARSQVWECASQHGFSLHCMQWNPSEKTSHTCLFLQSELEVLTRKPVCFIIFGKPVSQDSHHVWKFCSLCSQDFHKPIFFLSRELGRPPLQNVQQQYGNASWWMVRRIKKWDVQYGTITTRALSEFVIVSQTIIFSDIVEQ